MHHIVVMMLAAATVGMVMAPENAMRHSVGNQVDFTTVSAMEHFFGQVRPFVVMWFTQTTLFTLCESAIKSCVTITIVIVSLNSASML